MKTFFRNQKTGIIKSYLSELTRVTGIIQLLKNFYSGEDD